MYDYGYIGDAEMNIRDSVKGIVTRQNGSGLYIDLKITNDITGEGKETVPAFGYWYCKVPVGAEVTCSIKGWAKNGKDIKVKVDSVDYDMEFAA